MTLSPRRAAIVNKHMRDAFEYFVEARKVLTLGEFEQWIQDYVQHESGSRGFVLSIGKAIVAGAEEKATTS